MAWLLRDGNVLGAAEVAATWRERGRGLLGRDGVTGAMVFTKGRQVHTIGMRFPIDVAFCDRDGVVLRTLTVAPWRVTRLMWRAGFVVERRQGTSRIYRADKDALGPLRSAVEDHWRRGLGRVKDLAEAEQREKDRS